MKIEFIVSTMNCKDPIALINKMNLNNNTNLFVTIVNQVIGTDKIEYINSNIKIIYSSEIGVGNSRNLGLRNTFEESDIICFTDDDVVYKDDTYKLICNTFNSHHELDVAIFNVMCNDKKRQIKEIQKVHKIKNINIFRYALYNVVIKKSSMLNFLNLSFNTDFGGNSKYLCGEDSIFIYNLYKQKLNIKAFPINIALVKHTDSTWYNLIGTEHYFVSKGALFYTCDKKLYILYIIYFAIKHSKKYNIRIFTILKQMFKGANECKIQRGKSKK